ncbi:ChbG/HpnK family deacetylase [candidate division KSB1 bacterium]|nr:ChbG/HpnK family deacetylase [candidate division KSB1 bacterium]
MKIAMFLFGLIIIMNCSQNQTAIKATSGNLPLLLIRCDDIGMCHSVNLAAQQLIETGLPFSASVMFVCPWYQEAVDILKTHSEISVGVHLTLNAEWKNYRWGPILGKGGVPSLVDSFGYFFPSRAKFFANHPKIEEVEQELRAQIDRAIGSGLRIDYVDYHMGTAVDTPELRALVERLAKEYRLGISRYFSETDMKSIYSVPAKNKTDSLVAIVSRLEPGTKNLAVFHIGMETPEMNALVDLNQFGLARMSEHRQAELKALCSKKFQKILKAKHIRLVTYREMIGEVGLDSMKSPVNKDY